MFRVLLLAINFISKLYFRPRNKPIINPSFPFQTAAPVVKTKDIRLPRSLEPIRYVLRRIFYEYSFEYIASYFNLIVKFLST